MEADRFDRIARILAVAPSRRDILGFAFGSLIALRGWRTIDARKKGKNKKKKCGACGSCKSCVKGACTPKPNGAACGGVCEECRNGACVAKPDGTDCGNGDICQSGVCGCDPGFEPCGDACVQSCAGGQILNANCQCVCNAQSCDGCCDGETCLPVGGSQSDQKCGADGAACEGCGPNEQCTQGACACVSGFERCGGDCVQSCTGDLVLNDDCQCACPGSKHHCGGICKDCCNDDHCGGQLCCDGDCHECCADDDCDGDRTCQNHACQCAPNRDECGAICCAAGKTCVDPGISTCLTGRGTCETGGNTCLQDPQTEVAINCNVRSDCYCFQSIGGDTRCAQVTESFSCDQCTEDADCAEFGAGAFCVDGGGPFCCATGGQFCGIPCDTDPPGACPAGADTCDNPSEPILCNGRGDCFCMQVLGETRCLTFPEGAACGQCESDDECAAFGEGAVCFRDERPGCKCTPEGKGFCGVDCPALETSANRLTKSGDARQESQSRGSWPPAKRKSARARKHKRRR